MMMRRLIFIENLKNFLITKPPVVLFLFCLISFIIDFCFKFPFDEKTNIDYLVNLNDKNK